MNRLTRPELERMQHVCEEIAVDMKLDATRFEGQPFTGKTVAIYFGCQGAAIAGLAKILASLIQDDITR